MGLKREKSKPKAKRISRKRAAGKSASSPVDRRTRDLGDWRKETLSRMRTLIMEADPEIIEERKWRKPSNAMAGIPVWSRNGIICTGETYKEAVKLTFARGASLEDPQKLFNASLEGGTRRAIDIRNGETIDAKAFKALIRSAVAENLRSSSPKLSASPASGRQVVLLSGGNPQIAKGDGDGPVQAYIAAMPDWKHDIGKRLDALIVRKVPDVRKAVKWNSPFYGIEGQGWFMSFHVFARYVKVTFFKGTSLRPLPPGPSKVSEVRYVDIHQNALDEAQMAKWIQQAAALPGWIP